MCPATQVPGQQPGLVEASFPLPGLVKRYRQDHIRSPILTVLDPKRVEQAGQRPGQAGMRAILELVDDLLERILQPAVGSGEIEAKLKNPLRQAAHSIFPAGKFREAKA